MTDEPEAEAEVTEPTEPNEQATATADKEEKKEPGKEEKKEEKLVQTVEIADIGPCRKHIKVSVDRAAIDGRFNEKYKELMGDAQIPGFRPGKAPRRIVVRHFEKDVTDQIKGQVLLASLEQLAEEHDVAPLSAP